MAMAIAEMARSQLLLEARLDQRLQKHEEQFAEQNQRLERIESALGDTGRFITPEQAMEISQAVKLVAMELYKRTRKNEYGAVYGQFYRQFRIASYKQLPANQFQAAIDWLTDWYRRITGAPGDEIPF
jgi:ferritin-like metal-binding protein YciE